jgi:hypothetical protein
LRYIGQGENEVFYEERYSQRLNRLPLKVACWLRDPVGFHDRNGWLIFDVLLGGAFARDFNRGHHSAREQHRLLRVPISNGARDGGALHSDEDRAG